MARLLDPKKNGRFPFEYHDSAHTNVKDTIERARREQKERAEQEQRNADEAARKTVRMERRR